MGMGGVGLGWVKEGEVVVVVVVVVSETMQVVNAIRVFEKYHNQGQ